MSENRDTKAIFGASHFADEFALICRAICFSKMRFSLAFYRRNLVFFPLGCSLEFIIHRGKPSLLVCRLYSPPIDQSFCNL